MTTGSNRKLRKTTKGERIICQRIKSIEEQVESNSQKKINLYKSLGSEEQRIQDLKERKTRVRDNPVGVFIV